MRNVLVIDDSVSVRKVIERALTNERTHVLSASSGGEARERIEKEAPDLIVCDVLMPDVDGYEICEWVKAHPRLAGTPVLLISGVINDAVRARAAQARADDLLGKPFAPETLLAAVERLLERAYEPTASATPGAFGPRAAPGDGAVLAPPDLKRLLEPFGAMPGVRLAALVDRDGFIIESTGDVAVDAEIVGALASCLGEASAGIGRELGHGALHGLLLEYDKGVISLHAVGDAAMLALLIAEAPALGKVRYYVRKLLPELARAM
ncbi:MAG: response regulator [Candidatus Rokubacteria bacterium]|nr:response regulator [Candidatus Rokubacteria bacterium]